VGLTGILTKYAGASGAAADGDKRSKGKPATFGEVPCIDLRWAAARFIASVLALPNHFQEIKLIGLFFTEQTDHVVVRRKEGGHDHEDTSATPTTTGDEETRTAAAIAASSDSLKPIGELRGFTNKVLVETVTRETDVGVLQALFWVLDVKVLEDAGTSPGIAQVAISAITNKLVSHVPWPPPVVRCALQVLGDWAQLQDVIHLSSSATIPLLLKRLCELITKYMAETRTKYVTASQCVHICVFA
jgi:hypothetical protein